MKAAAAELDFERAARLRDDIGALERVLEKSAVVLPDATDADVFALAEDELEVAVQVFHVRGGRVRGQRGWVAERDAETTGRGRRAPPPAGLRRRVAPRACRARCSCPCSPTTPTPSPPGWAGCAARRVDLRVPQRGDKRTLMETVRAQRRPRAWPGTRSPGPAT